MYLSREQAYRVTLYESYFDRRFTKNTLPFSVRIAIRHHFKKKMRSTREIPANAMAIKVTNVSSPSCIKIYHEEDYGERLSEIGNKLRTQMKHRKKKQPNTMLQPKIGDVVIMHNRLESELELPAWWIRGVVEGMNEKTMKFNIFLVDHGYTIKASREEFTIVRKSLIPDEYLTFSIGIYNLIPTLRKTERSKTDIDMEINKKWSDLAVRITRDLVSTSSKIYFKYLAVDDDGKKYGELYLFLDDEIVILSEILVRHEQAIYLSKDLFSVIDGRNRDSKNTINSVEGGIVVDVEKRILEPISKHRAPIENGKNEKDGKQSKRNFAPKGNKKLRYFGENCQQILVNSSVDCERLVSIEEARFPATIHKALRRLEIIALRIIQSYIWPAISKGLNVLAVGPPQCGKTTGYVLPIVSYIASRKTVPRGNNPTILILCSSTSDVLSTSSLCKELLEAYTDIQCVAGWNGRDDRSLVSEIYNGCQILVATPAFLVRFMNTDNEHRKLINFENLSCLVIDGIDVILNKYYEPLKQLFRKHVKIGKKESQRLDKEPIQMVAVARHWSSQVRTFAKECMIDPYVCIGSYMEAAIYGRVILQLTFIKSKEKIKKVTEYLDDRVSMIRTMIICCNSEEVRALNEHLSMSKKTLVACEKMAFEEINGVRECWQASVSGMYPILICTDDVLVNLNITNVDWLIHYSVALPSKTQFHFRFSTLMDNLKKGDQKCRARIFLDETNDVQLYSVISDVKNCGTEIPPNIMDFVMRTVVGLDREKKMYPICDNVKAFGFCPKKNTCHYRHCVLSKVDTPVTPIKIGDKVKFKITYVHNTTHFTARILEYINSENKVTRYSAEEYTKMSSNIQTYYADKRNRRCHRKIEVGDICAVEESLDNFQRVKVLYIVRKDWEGSPIAAKLKCIDTGAILEEISVTRLMEIPKDLANRDTHIVEVFLAGLVPYDDEYEWNIRAIDDTHSWLSNKTKKNSFVLGTVQLHLADVIWVDPLEIRSPIIGYPDLIDTSLKKHMLILKHGQPSKDHLAKLYELCRIEGVKNAEGEDIVPATIDARSENETDSLSS